MRDLTEQALKGNSAEYVEVRIEESSGTRIQYRGRELEEINRTSSNGGCVRALVEGGWGFVSFNTFDDLDAYVPSLHWYHSRRLAWLDVADDLPRYHGLHGDGVEPYRHGPVIDRG